MSESKDDANIITQAWKDLCARVEGCDRCVLASGRTKTVFGEGDRNSSLMFVGEGPGADEDAQGKPFVGKAGQLLTQILTAAGISRNSIFITNVVKCRPPGNRVPAFEEMDACSEYLDSQIALINPRIIVCLGSTPTKWLLRTTEGISRLRGRWFEWKGIKLFPMFHPSYLLRYQSKSEGSPKQLTWLDIQEVKRVWKEV